MIWMAAWLDSVIASLCGLATNCIKLMGVKLGDRMEMEANTGKMTEDGVPVLVVGWAS